MFAIKIFLTITKTIHLNYMKKTYQGLYTRRMVVECEPLMQPQSNAKIRVKTGPTESAHEWIEEERDLTTTTTINNSDLQSIINPTP